MNPSRITIALLGLKQKANNIYSRNVIKYPDAPCAIQSLCGTARAPAAGPAARQRRQNANLPPDSHAAIHPPWVTVALVMDVAVPCRDGTGDFKLNPSNSTF